MKMRHFRVYEMALAQPCAPPPLSAAGDFCGGVFGVGAAGEKFVIDK